MLVDAINHRMPEGTTETTVLGPFYLGEHKLTANGATLVSEEEGDPIFIEGTIKAPSGSPIVDAVIDMWHTDAEGLYDAQKPELHGAPKMRAQFKSDAQGRFWFKSVVPSSYPIPNDGPVGKLLDATKRHYMRPAHIHFHISAPGYETLVTHVFLAGDPWLESDAVFGVKKSLIADLTKSNASHYPDNTPAPKSWDLLHYDFGLKPAKNS
jgi:hydroxyquinol 1,2-dioxygenase